MTELSISVRRAFPPGVTALTLACLSIMQAQAQGGRQPPDAGSNGKRRGDQHRFAFLDPADASE